MDLNMLVSDFYVVTTTSRKGSRYDDLFSQSNGSRPVAAFPWYSKIDEIPSQIPRASVPDVQLTD